MDIEKDMGIYDAINKGLRLSNGKFINTIILRLLLFKQIFRNY